MIKIHVLHCGSVGVDPAVPFRDISKNPLAYTGFLRSSMRRIYLPVSTYLIEHPKGLILFDTSWHTDVREHPITHESFPLWFASKPILPPGEAVNEQLKSLGYQPSDLDFVILSHMDVDHVSGLRLVKDAKKIYASREELEASQSRQARYGNKKLWADIPIAALPFKKNSAAPYGKSFDLFNDGTVEIILMSGHSQGSVVLKITNANSKEFVILAADTGYESESWKSLRLPGPVSDKEAMAKSLRWVQQQSQTAGCKEVLACHDRQVVPHIITL